MYMVFGSSGTKSSLSASNRTLNAVSIEACDYNPLHHEASPLFLPQAPATGASSWIDCVCPMNPFLRMWMKALSPAKRREKQPSRLAELKARAVWNQHPGSVVIGSDQTADLHGVRLGKPHTRENAVKQLSAMQGEETVFATALCVIDAQGHAPHRRKPHTGAHASFEPKRN